MTILRLLDSSLHGVYIVDISIKFISREMIITDIVYVFVVTFMVVIENTQYSSLYVQRNIMGYYV